MLELVKLDCRCAASVVPGLYHFFLVLLHSLVDYDVGDLLMMCHGPVVVFSLSPAD
jgi:hypothetical protein